MSYLCFQELSLFVARFPWIPIIKIDERMSSKLFKNSSKDRIDDLSALEILESYIYKND